MEKKKKKKKIHGQKERRNTHLDVRHRLVLADGYQLLPGVIHGFVVHRNDYGQRPHGAKRRKFLRVGLAKGYQASEHLHEAMSSLTNPWWALEKSSL